MPLHIFIEIVVTGDTSPVGDAWLNIFSEYCEAIGNGELSESLRLAIQINYLTNRIYIVKSGAHLPELLTEMGFRTTDPKRVLTLLKSDEVKLIKATADYKKLQSKQTAPTRADFAKDLVTLSKHMGYTISKFKIMVAEYVEMINDLKNGK